MNRYRLALFSCSIALHGSCKNPDLEPETYFEQRIAPILQENCVNGPANNKCHVESDTLPGTAFGNLDLSSYEAIHRRPELLAAYGSYPDPALLMKALKPFSDELVIQYGGVSYTGEILHAGGGLLSRSSEAFLELQQWLEDGATEDGRPREPVPLDPHGACSSALRPDVMPFLAGVDATLLETFRTTVQPVLAERCGFSSCHGAAQSDFYVTCGDDDMQLRHNFVVAQSFVSLEPDRSELLLRPLATEAGGVHHSGGDLFGSTNDGEYQAIRTWAAAVGPLQPGAETAEFRYFADHVMPAFLRRGCAMPQCHSPQGFNDFRLRAGTRGFFSPLALRRNYEETRREFADLDVPDPNQSRILKKNVERGGIAHRAGITLLQASDGGGDPTVCPAGDEAQPSSYCTVVEWLRRERAAAVEAGLVAALAVGDTVPIVYVDRPANDDRLIDFDTYRGDARLMRVDAVLGERGRLESFGAAIEIDLSGCTGGATDYDVRGPEVSPDGTRIAFALRLGADDGLDVHVAALDGTACTALTTDGQGSDSGVAIHNFDPLWIPEDPERNPGGAMVYASTRPGKLGRAQVSPRYRLPASNLWRSKLDGSGIEQMTFLNGSELSPALMHNGQVTMTTEKATEAFYQLSGRRINWDLTDYHPLLGQRASNDDEAGSVSIGFGQATEIREDRSRDFLVVLSDAQSRFAGGALATFNRSLGPFEAPRADQPAYVPAVRFLDPAARDAGKGPATGAYRSPFPALDGAVLVSYAAGELDLTDPGAAVDYDLVVFDPDTLERRTVAGGGDGRFQVDGVIAIPRALRYVFDTRPQLVFGGRTVTEARAADEAWAHFPDLPMLATLLTDNHRGDRGLDRFVEGDTLAIYRADPPPAGDGDDGSTFQSLALLGTAALREDGSAFVRVPAGTPLVLELQRGGQPLLTMTEEHQFGPGEQTSLGIARGFFDGVCGGCHGSIEGPELDVVVDPDALTAASISLSRPEPTSSAAPL